MSNETLLDLYQAKLTRKAPFQMTVSIAGRTEAPLEKFAGTKQSLLSEGRLSVGQAHRVFEEPVFDSLISKYLAQISMTEKYEVLINEVSKKSANLLILMVAIFSIIIVLTAIFFSSLQHG
jgi:hypothetical protein